MLGVMSCSGGSIDAPGAEQEMRVADSGGPVHLAPAAADEMVMPLNGKERKLIHTANLHAEVSNLYDATSRIESATLQLGGQVASSTMSKNLEETREERSGADSLQQFRRYAGTAVLSLRVPVARLDTLLRIIAAQTSFIDSRAMHIDDATFRHLANALHNRGLATGERVVAGASAADGLEARQYLDQRRDAAVERQVQNLRLDDDAAYASLAIELRQPDEVVVRTSADVSRLMQPGPGQQFLLSLRQGWELLYALLLGLLSIWPLLIFIGVVAVLVRKWYRRQQPAPATSR